MKKALSLMSAFIALTFILSGCGGNKQLTEEEWLNACDWKS